MNTEKTKQDRGFMKKVIVSLLSLLLSSVAVAQYTCDTFTEEQEQLLKMAYVVGVDYDRGYTLAGIIWRESFVGEYVIRVNSNDGDYGSYGIGHMQLSTAMYMLDVDSSWQAKSHLVPLMISDDIFSMSLSMKYLIKKDTLTNWRASIRRYNGSGSKADEYADDVIERIRVLEKCGFMQNLENNINRFPSRQF